MSDEEDKKKNCNAGKAFAGGLVATAIGVGIGAALYYFLGRDSENPEEPSTSYHAEEKFSEDDSFSTIEANTTSDTSINTSHGFSDSENDTEGTCSNNSDIVSSSVDENLDSDSDDEVSENSDSVDSESEPNSHDNSRSSDSESTSEMSDFTSDDSEESEDDEWETAIDVDIVSAVNVSSANRLMNRVVDKIRRKYEKISNRKRAYTLEECSICFDVMLADEELMALACTHNFHLKCITPWLEQHQTCPVCRNKAD